MKQRAQLNLIVAVVACGLMTGAVGCQSTRGKLAEMNPIKDIGDSKPPVGVPERVVGTWTEAVLHQSGKGTRGFGGRLFFYERGSADPIRVAGQLVVYAFAEDDRAATDNKPTKRYVFPNEQFAKHESQSEAGVSYSIWLPWDTTGGEQADVSLIARFEPSQGGGLVVSNQTRHRLPGTAQKETLLAKQPKTPTISQISSTASGKESATLASYEEATTKNKPTMTATTISLPGRFKNASQPADSPSSTPPTVTLPASQNTADLKPEPFGTKVEYFTPGESVRRSLRPKSSDSLR